MRNWKSCYMKIFLTILATLFFSCQIVFAAIPASGKQSSQQKMLQLQQLLARTMQKQQGQDQGQDQKLNNPSMIPGTANVGTMQQTSMQAPSAGLVSAAAAFSQDNAQAANKNTNAPTTDVTTSDSESSKQSSVYDQAFANVVSQMLPMSAQQIAKLREVFTENQLAAATPPGIPPKPTSTSLLVNLSPQATPPVIRLGAGYITSLVFVDSTGQPWPIAAYSIGDPSAFNIQWDHKGNTVLIQASSFYKRSNLAVLLRDLNTPVMITLIAGQEAVDYRVDLRIPGIGPNALFIQNGIPEGVNPVLLDVLNGIAPKGSKELKTSGGDCKAWLLKNKLYLRTSLNVISPGWQATMSSIDGTRAYQMQPSPVILALQNGRDKILTLMLEGLE